jgi:hypothetical protein
VEKAGVRPGLFHMETPLQIGPEAGNRIEIFYIISMSAWAPDAKKPAAGDTSQRAFALFKERTFPPRNAFECCALEQRLPSSEFIWRQGLVVVNGLVAGNRTFFDLSAITVTGEPYLSKLIR